MKALSSQKGFTLVEALILITVIVLLSVCGWLVYDRQKDKKSSDSPAQNSINSFEECKAAGNPIMESYPEQCSANGKSFVNEKQNQQSADDETASWLLYEAKDTQFTTRIADGWKVYEAYHGAGIYTFDNNALASKPGTKAVLMPFPGGGDGQTGFFLNYASQNIEQIVTPGQKQSSLKTNDGLEIEKYHWVVSGQADEGLGTRNGDTEYTYVIRKSSSRVITAVYSHQPGDTDHHEVVEKVLKTIHFN